MIVAVLAEFSFPWLATEAQRQEAASHRPSDLHSSDYEDGALARRTDSLTAALALLERWGALVDQVGLAIYKFRYHVYVEISSYHLSSSRLCLSLWLLGLLLVGRFARGRL